MVVNTPRTSASTAPSRLGSPNSRNAVSTASRPRGGQLAGDCAHRFIAGSRREPWAKTMIPVVKFREYTLHMMQLFGLLHQLMMDHVAHG